MTKKATKKNTLKKSASKTSNVKMFVNDYEIPMLEIKGEKRNTYISVNKALAILATQEDASLLETVEAYGRELTQVSYGDGRKFKVGAVKMNAVLDNAAAINDAVA